MQGAVVLNLEEYQEYLKLKEIKASMEIADKLIKINTKKLTKALDQEENKACVFII